MLQFLFNTYISWNKFIQECDSRQAAVLIRHIYDITDFIALVMWIPVQTAQPGLLRNTCSQVNSVLK